MKVPSAAPFLPQSSHPSWLELREAAAGCRGCELYREGSQTVFGEGSRRAALFFVGEQPGDQEDLEGLPFVGPAGKLLRKALAEAGVPAQDAYLTNAVKHFHWVASGKRRLHQKPRSRHLSACRPWLEAELAKVKPEVIVCLGATALQSVMGKVMPVLKNRGRVFRSPLGEKTLVTYHPSALLRMPDRSAREEAYQDFLQDLKFALRVSQKSSPD